MNKKVRLLRDSGLRNKLNFLPAASFVCSGDEEFIDSVVWLALAVRHQARSPFLSTGNRLQIGKHLAETSKNWSDPVSLWLKKIGPEFRIAVASSL